jgi:hypothetical protein
MCDTLAPGDNFSIILGFLVVAVSGHEMPRYDNDGTEMNNPDEPLKPDQEFTRIRFWKTVLIMVYIYYTISCGLEAFFQVNIPRFHFLQFLRHSQASYALLLNHSQGNRPLWHNFT